MNYSQIKKLDEDTQKNLQEGSGPVSECLCALFAPPDESKGLRGSIKRALASMGGRRGGGKGRGGVTVSGGKNTVDIPLTFDRGGKGVYTTKEEVKRGSSCGKCGCDKEKVFMKTSYANIRITSPDVSSICPCPDSACMPGKDKLNNNISVTVERVELSNAETADKATEDPKTEEKTTQVRNRWQIPSNKNLIIETPHLKDQKDAKTSSIKNLNKENEKRPSFKELYIKKNIEEDRIPIPRDTKQQWRRNENIEEIKGQTRKLKENSLNTEKTASRPKDQSVEYSESFSGRLEEQHDDVLRRLYHD